MNLFLRKSLMIRSDNMLSQKKIRLAKLMIQMENPEQASQYIEEGLEIEPTNSELLQLKKQIDKK